MYPSVTEEADVIFYGKPMRLEYAVEYHTMRHHADCEAPIAPTHGRTWDQLGDDLAARFPPHVWHPRHGDVYEVAYPPAAQGEPPPLVRAEAVKHRKPHHEAELFR